MKRILICGGRDYSNVDSVAHIIKEALRDFKDIVIIQGGATGADRLAKEFCERMGIPCITMFAPWSALGPRAGTLRNEWMLKYCNPDMVIAFPGGKGTANMLKQAKDAGILNFKV